jgi:SAM-dependent methyltransferase
VFPLPLTCPPDRLDEYGQPCYAVQQATGLAETHGEQLLAPLLASGYLAAVATGLRQVVVEEIDRLRHGRLLDIVELGGATGRMFNFLEPAVRTYINVEPGRFVIENRALDRLRHPKYACIKCSAESIPLPDRSCDVVFAMASFDHIPDADRALTEVRRLLRPGGSFLLVMNNRRSWWKAALANTRYLQRRQAIIARDHFIQWSAAECARALAAHLTVSKVYSQTFVPYVPYVWRVLLPIADAVGPRLNPRAGANLVVVGEKPT